MTAERGVGLAHTTVLRWVHRDVPAFEKRWRVYAHPLATSWRVDETSITVKGRWTFLDPAVDKQGRTVDFLSSPIRDTRAATRFFHRATQQSGAPEKVALDGYAASHGAVTALQEEGVLAPQLAVRTSRYLNNLVEQEHRRVKQRVRPLRGFKRFTAAEVTRTGIELRHNIRQGQFERSGIGRGAAAAWETVLAA